MFYTRFLNSYMNWSLKKRDFARARSLFKRKDIGMKRYFMAFIGVVFIGFSVAVLNLSGFGVDPFSCMNMSVSAHLPFSFGVWQIFVNAVILMLLVIHVIKEKKKIGAIFGFGTLWNMTGVGLLVDFFTTKYHIFFQNPQNLGIRILFLVIAILGIFISSIFSSASTSLNFFAEFSSITKDIPSNKFVILPRNKLPFPIIMAFFILPFIISCLANPK